ESEGADRTFGLPPGQDELIREIAAVNRNIVVVITSGGGVDMNTWIDRVSGLIEAWYPGQEGGTALAEILFGDVNPSGRLPVSFERRWEDSPVHDSYYPEPGSKRIVYKEGIFVGYRGYDQKHVEPLFPFGFGLSYTTFKYRNLVIKPDGQAGYQVSFTVQNTGNRAAAEVGQVYVQALAPRLPRPLKELKGFRKIFLKPGEEQSVSVSLGPRSFAFYDTDKKGWAIEPGDYRILVGASSVDLQLHGDMKLAAASLEK